VMSVQNENGLVIEDVAMTDDVKSRVVKESLPAGLKDTMDVMRDGQSFFMEAEDVQKKMYALRSAYYRWKQKNPEDLHNFSFIREKNPDGKEGIRVYKYIPSGEKREDY